MFGFLRVGFHYSYKSIDRPCLTLMTRYLVLLLIQVFVTKLMDILVIEHINVPYEKREMTLEYINQVSIFHGFVTILVFSVLSYIKED